MTSPHQDQWPPSDHKYRRSEVTGFVGSGDAVWHRTAREVLHWKVKTRNQEPGTRKMRVFVPHPAWAPGRWGGSFFRLPTWRRSAPDHSLPYASCTTTTMAAHLPSHPYRAADSSETVPARSAVMAIKVAARQNLWPVTDQVGTWRSVRLSVRGPACGTVEQPSLHGVRRRM